MLNAEKNSRAPDFVFLAHIVDVSSCMHNPFTLRTFTSIPYRFRFFLIPFWPIAITSLILMWLWSKVFLVTFYNLRGRLHQTWAVPRFGFQVSLKNLYHFTTLTINNLLKNINTKKVFLSLFSFVIFFFAVFLAICC